jgi:hypothetical protein
VTKGTFVRCAKRLRLELLARLRLELTHLTPVIRTRLGNLTGGATRFRRPLKQVKTFLPKKASAIVLLCAVCALQAQETRSQPVNGGQEGPSVLTTTLGDREQDLGPFTIAGQSFTVVVREKSLPGGSEGGVQQTLAALELRDGKGTVLYQKDFPVEVEEGKFRQTMSASARLLAGKNLTGLLISYVWERNGEAYGEAWQLFGFRDGQLGLYDTEMGSNGPSVTLLKAQNGAVTCVPTVPDGEVVEFRVWAGNFYLIVPMRVDWSHHKLILEQQPRCFIGRREAGCDRRVEAERKPADAETTFLRLFPGPEPNMGMVRHVVVKRNSRVQILNASAVIQWGTSGGLMWLGFRDLWLKVLIDDSDDKEGWIQGAEDFAAAGLPARSFEP